MDLLLSSGGRREEVVVLTVVDRKSIEKGFRVSLIEETGVY